MVSPPEYPGKVVRGVITDLFGNLAYLLVCIRQIIYGVGHPPVSYTHLDVYKRQTGDFQQQGKLFIFWLFMLDME